MKDFDLTFRTATLDDLTAIHALFSGAITSTCKNDYNEEQRTVWKASVKRTERWTTAIKEQYFLLALHQQTIVGFGSLKDGNYIDFMYVHKDHLRKGIAQRIYALLEQQAQLQKQQMLSTDASITARPFFEQQGFTAQKEQENHVGNVILINYKMYKSLY
ncbi:MAG: GNAT family N-acetyltransferase [Crocinitomicaceae bacterium]|nr:GNAT family N-acetyltransferase [Crocinitomicaceae bacterium]|tara:strand:+ start:12705 stop:13184 length:480 start_codon:yes stop_codon:yes gene_type:complete